MVDVVVPKWGLTMEDGEMGQWMVVVGETVAEGDILAEIETDKVTGELVSPAAGVVAEIVHTQGSTVAPGDVVARIDAA